MCLSWRARQHGHGTLLLCTIVISPSRNLEGSNQKMGVWCSIRFATRYSQLISRVRPCLGIAIIVRHTTKYHIHSHASPLRLPLAHTSKVPVQVTPALGVAPPAGQARAPQGCAAPHGRSEQGSPAHSPAPQWPPSCWWRLPDYSDPT